MNQQQLNQFRDALVQACDNHLASGRLITDTHFHNAEGCCPIYCLIEGQEPYGNFEDRLFKKLGFPVSKQEMWSFIAGFDNSLHQTPTGDPVDTRLYQLGQELRRKYIKVEYTRW